MQNDKETQSLSEYIVELSLLHSELGQYSPAQIAAAAVLLARLATAKGRFANHNINSHNSVENGACSFIKLIGVHDMFRPLLQNTRGPVR